MTREVYTNLCLNLSANPFNRYILIDILVRILINEWNPQFDFPPRSFYGSRGQDSSATVRLIVSIRVLDIMKMLADNNPTISQVIASEGNFTPSQAISEQVDIKNDFRALLPQSISYFSLFSLFPQYQDSDQLLLPLSAFLALCLSHCDQQPDVSYESIQHICNVLSSNISQDTSKNISNIITSLIKNSNNFGTLLGELKRVLVTLSEEIIF